jgi:hypothetical protein
MRQAANIALKTRIKQIPETPCILNAPQIMNIYKLEITSDKCSIHPVLDIHDNVKQAF